MWCVCCVLFVTECKRVGHTSAHSSCGATKKRSSAVLQQSKQKKDKRSEPDLSLWIYLYRVITAQSVLPWANPPYLKALHSEMAGWLAWEVAELSPHTPLWRDTPLAVKRNTPSWHSACNNNNNWPSLFFWVDPPSLEKKVAAHHMCVFDLCRFFTMI
jgi:hypothetical protein